MHTIPPALTTFDYLQPFGWADYQEVWHVTVTENRCVLSIIITKSTLAAFFFSFFFVMEEK